MGALDGMRVLEVGLLIQGPQAAAMLHDWGADVVKVEDDKAELFPLLDEVFRDRTTADWCELFSATGVRYAPVRDPSNVVEDAGIWENGYLVRVEGNAGEVVVPGSPVRFSDTPARVAADALELGQHTEEVLLGAGYSWEDIAGLSGEGVI